MGSISEVEHSHLYSLATDIGVAAHDLTNFLHDTRPEVLQGTEAGSHDIPHNAPADISRIKSVLIEKTMAIQQLIMSATDVQQQMTLQTQQMAGVRWICRFRVAGHIPDNGSISYGNLASAAGVPEDQLARICRMAMTTGFFREPVPGEIAHTHTSPDLRVIDVGGSTGHCCVPLTKEFPALKFTVQDLPPVLAQAKIPGALEDKISLQAHDFLTVQPADTQGADVFFIRQCLQSWSHADAVEILRNILPAMDRAKSRIVIMSVVLASAGDPPIGQRGKGISRMRDLFMMQAMGGQERDLQQWEALVRDADAKLRIVSVSKPEGSVLSVIDVRFEED